MAQKHVRGSSTVKGPIKATESFGLIQSPSSSNNKASRTSDYSLVRPGETVRKPQRRSPESRTSPECLVSPGLKEQRRRQSPRPFDAVETANLYVRGAWPREPASHPYQADKAVQTECDYSDELTDARGRPILHRSSSAGRGDAGRREKVRSALLRPNKPISQKTSSSPSLCSRGTSTPRPAPRSSPTPACTTVTNSPSPLSHRSKPIHIPTHIPTARIVPIIKGSVEGDNMEIEKLWACQPENMNTCGDGRQAPVVELLCQGSTVRGEEEDVSPLLPAGLTHTDYDHSPIAEGTAGSPDIKDEELQPKSILARLPPDGCEKVKVIDERRSSTSSTDSFTLAKVGQWRPSAQSAFCPLLKPYVYQSGVVCEGILVADKQ